MSNSAKDEARAFYALTYDRSLADWPGEIDFYLVLAQKAHAKGQAVLEVACGTGRIALRLARDGAALVGLDRSEVMLAVAREKGAGLDKARWVQGDMRAFELGQTFGLILIPGHSFQNLVTAADQVACLQSIRRHLAPDGTLVIHLDHQDVRWLGDLRRDKGGVFEPAETFAHPETGRPVRTLRSWSYEPATQTAVVQTVWEEIDADGQVAGRWETGPVRLHCLFRFEMEHLLARAGFAAEALYGDFFGGPLTDESSEMVWVAGFTRDSVGS